MKNTIIERAKRTDYKHKNWFLEGGKSVYDAVSYFVSSGDFYLDTTVKYIHQVEGYKGDNTRSDIVNYLIENANNEGWKQLVIRYGGSEGGSDRGKLKILTFIELLKRKDNKLVSK